MPRPLTPLQAYENGRFLERFALSGNVRLAAREVGVKYGTVQHRRKKHAGFAQAWEATAAAVQARLHLAGGKRGPEAAVIASPSTPPAAALRINRRSAAAKQSRKARGGHAGAGLPSFGCLQGRRSGQARSAPRNDGREEYRTKGGEPIVVRTRNGKLQIRLAHPDKLTKACEQAFLYALSATANIRLSAAAAGASPAAFYRRRRQDAAFAREMRLALKMGYERLEAAALEAAMPQSHQHDRWRTCASSAPIPPLSSNQIFQIICLHEKGVRQGWEQPHRRRRRGESDPVYIERLRAMGRVQKSLEAEAEAVRRAACYEATGGWRHSDEPPPPELVPLDLVTGWSRASGRPAHHEGVALFGGWRIGDMEKRMAKR